MKRISLLMAIFCWFVMAIFCLLAFLSIPGSAQTFTLTVNSSGATNIVTTGQANVVTVYENASTPTAAFSVTDPGNGPGVTLNFPVGGQYTFVSKPGFARGATIGTIQAASGSGFNFAVVQRPIEVWHVASLGIQGSAGCQ